MTADFTPKTLAALKERSGGICEGCGINLASEAHHRQYKSRGGLGTLENALHLCGWGNSSGCHGIAHTLIGEQRGWSVRSKIDPATVPVFHLYDSTWTIDPTGTDPQPVDPARAVAFMVSIGAIRDGLTSAGSLRKDN